MSDETLVLTETDGFVATITLNRPKARNALSVALLDQLIAAVAAADADPQVRCIILTGGPKVFAAGADIKGMLDATPVQIMEQRMVERWAQIGLCRTPVIAAVSGYALGGGCELAMLCDIIVAAEDAQFGLPEINLGVIPGAGGTQRLTRAIGPYRAMELILTGAPISAREAQAYGLVNRICPPEEVLAEATRLARQIAEKAPVALRMAKEAVRAAAETTLREGLEIERRNFYMLFDTQDQKEGMRAFVEKRKAQFTGK